mmetsp:Transcript_20737/g.54952  ORF Transcript_20737/g.54952 Transcript_20737/m.54952 type:complete len:464 (+) Transcript_20737:941-2332(+)
MREVAHLVLVLVLGSLAPVAVLYVILLLLAQKRDHVVNGDDDLVKVAAGLHRIGNLRDAEAMGQARQLLELVEGGVAHGRHRVGGRDVLAELDERGRGVGEDRPGLLAAHDLDRLADAHQLLGAEAGALGPLRGLQLALRLGLLEEDLVRLELSLGVVLERLPVREGLALRGVIALLSLKRQLQGRELGLLGRQELLEGLLRVGLLGVVLLDVHGEGVVHALQDALDLSRLGSIVAEWVVVGPDLCKHGALGGNEVLGVLDEAPDHVEVLARHRLRLLGAEHPAHTGDHAQELRVPEGGRQERVPVLARTGEDLDGRLQSAGALLVLGLLAVEVVVLLVAHLGGLALRVEVLRDHLLEVLDLRAVRRDLGLGLEDERLRVHDLLLLGGDVVGLAPERRLAPARVLVVGLLLHLAVGLDLRLQLAEQTNDPRHGRRLQARGLSGRRAQCERKEHHPGALHCCCR